MKLLFLRKNPSEAAIIVYLFAVGLIGLPYAEIGGLFTSDPVLAEIAGLAVCRLFASAVMLAIAVSLGLGRAFYPRTQKKRIAAVGIPAGIIALNNLPIIALACGKAGITAPALTVVAFAAECLFVAAFEEISFRGIIFPLLLQAFGTARKGRFTAVLLSAALFGGLHFINLLSGGGFGAVLLQAGYSFLIGAMLAVVLFEGGSVVLCVLLHAVYNLCGLAVPTLGFGGLWDIWNIPTIVLTVVISLAVCGWLVYRFWRADDAPARELIFVKQTDLWNGVR